MFSPRRRAVLTVALLVLALTPPLAACLWDYDTLRAEARGLPGLVEILTGRFERQPPAYYEMRLARAAAAVAANPGDLGAYDNAAVACDRLGRGDEAVAWMAKKKAQLDGMDPASADVREHLYRYHANLGTVLAHRWLRSGMDRSDMAGFTEGRGHIARAIELNPDAHFGREKYQLMAMDWIITPPAREYREHGLVHLFWHVQTFETGFGRGELGGAGYEDAVAGLTGLIVLGDAWESLDVHYALMLALQDRRDAALGSLARQRCLELVEAGRRSLRPENPTDKAGLRRLIEEVYEPAVQAPEIASFFTRARAEADSWQKSRHGYMAAQFAQGKHPDTDADFWAGFSETSPPRPPGAMFGSARADQLVADVAPLVVGGVLTVALLVVLRRRIRRRRVAGVQPAA